MQARPLILYHGPHCADGFGAAYAAWRRFGSGADYLPVNYGQEPPPEAFAARPLYVLDFSYPRSTCEWLAKVQPPRDVLILDHHDTAREALDGLSYAVFDMTRSGAVLAWEHFHPGVPVPLLLRYVQDRDLWQWKLPASREFSAGLSLVPREFDFWDQMARGIGDDENRQDSLAMFTRLIERGEAVLQTQRRIVEAACRDARVGDFAGRAGVPVAYANILQSEIGEALLARHQSAPFAVIASAGHDGTTYSLRAREGGFHVGALAKEYGGGGHPAAAGFRVPGPDPARRLDGLRALAGRAAGLLGQADPGNDPPFRRLEAAARREIDVPGCVHGPYGGAFRLIADVLWDAPRPSREHRLADPLIRLAVVLDPESGRETSTGPGETP